MASSFHQTTTTTPLIKLLLVEHEAISRLGLTQLLISAGYLVISTASGEEALETLQTECFDAVITDSGLGRDVSGNDILTEFERLHPGKPKLLITARPPSKVGEEVVEATYISKPIELEDFLLKLKSVLPV